MKVAALQAPLSITTARDALALIRRHVDQCEAEGVRILCCPEAVVGGLADYAADPFKTAVPTSGILAFLAPIADANLTVIVGFSELSSDGALYNAAAVVSHGKLAGVYRKQRPALRRSVYRGGKGSPVFHAEDVCFGILICYDSTFLDLGTELASGGARVLFVPTNNALPLPRASTELLVQARACDVALATQNDWWIVRADVAGTGNGLRSVGASAITSPAGKIVASARVLTEDLLVAEIDPTGPATGRPHDLLARAVRPLYYPLRKAGCIPSAGRDHPTCALHVAEQPLLHSPDERTRGERRSDASGPARTPQS